MTLMLKRRTLLAAPALLAATPAFAAGDFPNRPVRLVVGFPAGGGVDLTARPLAQKLSERLGQQMVVENRGGAAGNVALEYVARSAPDGYTLIKGNVGMMAINPGLYRNLTFDTVRDFAPIGQSVSVPLAVFVNSELPVSSIQEFVAYARARPGQLNMGSGGNGGIPHLAFEMFRRALNLDIQHIPYRGSAPALQDLLGGRIEVMIDGYNLARGAHLDGRLRMLATTGPARLAALADVPTLAESVAPGFEATGWQGVFAPAATPVPILERLESAMAWAMRETDLPQAYIAQGQVPAFDGRAALGALVERERNQWGEVIRAAGVTLT